MSVFIAKVRKAAIGLSGHGFPETENEKTQTKKTDKSVENIHHMLSLSFYFVRGLGSLQSIPISITDS
jgi:hypothetical protein